MRNFLFISAILYLLVLSPVQAVSQTENIDVDHYDIRLEITDFKKQTISGNCELTVTSIVDHSTFHLDLLGLTVDSVKNAQGHLDYSHDGSVLNITWDLPFNRRDVLRKFTVYYHGAPKRDTDWGGFLFSDDYAFNLGVGFKADPHNFGRVWFPCKDNFVDRSTYDYHITTTPEKVARCNGELIDTTHSGGLVTYHWKMSEPIPTYLSSVGVAPYVLNIRSYRDIPIELASERKDSLNMALSFKNLNHAVDAFLDNYGPHNFNKIGYHLVPFNGGAMEHASNIAYPRFACDGGIDYETLYAHELAHHWWGNTVTCRTAEDMWINEGWARYSENLFIEQTYGKEAYKKAVSDLHKKVIHTSHLSDGDTLAVSGIGHEHTYGSHVYNKGGDIIHTLRSYMGDEDFFKACQSFLIENKFKDVNSFDLRDHFQKSTQVNLTSFFDNWVFNKGFPHFDILEWESTANGDKHSTELTIRQRLKFAPAYFDNVPIEVTAFSSGLERYDTIVFVSGPSSTYEITSPFQPEFIALDMEQRISDAITDDYIVLNDTGSYNFGDALMDIRINEINEEAIIRVTHNWIGPDKYFIKSELPFLSKERYWTVDGVWSEGTKAEAIIEYNGRKTGTNYALGYLDVDLITIHEDSLKLFYRPHPSAYWEEYDNYTRETGSKFDRKGLIHIHNLQRGEYALAMNNGQLLGVDDARNSQTISSIVVFPNPAKDFVTIECENGKDGMLEITDQMGKLVYCRKLRKDPCSVKVNTSKWANGIYYAGIAKDGQMYTPKIFLVRN